MVKTIIPLFLVLLASFLGSEEGKIETSQEMVNQETNEKLNIPNQIDSNQIRDTETALTEEEAVEIAKTLMAEFNQLMGDMGEKNGWNIENPADYEVAKPELLKVATEEFSDHSLKEYVESYYCNCDSIWFPTFDDRTVRIEAEPKEDSFSVKGLVLPDYISGGYEMTLNVAKEDGHWKLDGWDPENFVGKDMNLTKEEIQTAHPDMEIMEEQTLDEYGVTVYRAKSAHEEIGISKKDGMLFSIE